MNILYFLLVFALIVGIIEIIKGVVRSKRQQREIAKKIKDNEERIKRDNQYKIKSRYIPVENSIIATTSSYGLYLTCVPIGKVND